MLSFVTKMNNNLSKQPTARIDIEEGKLIAGIEWVC